MTLTLLIDLDDTLLGNDMSTFLPVYLQSLAGHLAPFAEPNVLVRTLLAATRQMINNRRPDRTLEETFESTLYPALNIDSEQLREPFETFYAEIFPTLRGYTSFRPQAVQLVEEALDKGFKVVIATNPLFPRTAILQRLAWAGIPAEDFPLSLITSYENFHFTKPNPAYYAEILARLGWPEGPVVMIGDDMQNDIAAARRLGLPAYWITQNGNHPPNSPYKPTASGSLDKVLPWVQATSPETLIPVFSEANALLAILRATPAALASLADSLPDSLLTECPQAGEWCLTEIFCHLRDVDREVNLPRLKKVIHERNPFLPGMDTDPWAEERQYICQDGQGALTDFTTTRIEILDILDGIHLEAWQRSARHAIFGPTSLQELVSIIAGHDRLHVRQIHQTHAKVLDMASLA